MQVSWPSGASRWFSSKESTCQCRRYGFDPWVEKIPWRRKWQPTPVYLPGESPWAEEPGWLQSMGSQRVGHDWVTKQKQQRYRGFLGVSVVKNLPANAGDMGLIPWSGRYPEEGNGNTLRYPCLGNSMDRRVWQTTVHSVAKSWTRLKRLNNNKIKV